MDHRLEDLEWFVRFGRAGGVLIVSPHAGALIAMGRRARLDVVRTAASLIRERYVTGDEPIAPRARRRLEAYLAQTVRKPERLARLREAAHREGVRDGTAALATLVEACARKP